METRKVQLSGGTTFTVSLPKTWATEHGISSGSVLYLHPDDDGTLLVEAGTERSDDDRTVRLDVTGYRTAMVRQAVTSMYLVGIDKLVIVDRNGHDDARLEAALDLCAELSGLELMETSDRTLVFQNIVDPSSISIRKTVLRMKLVVLSMHRDAVRAVTDGDVALASRVVARDNEVDKLFCLVSRQFQRALDDLQTVDALDTTRSALFEYFHTARQFERIGDHATKMAGLVVEHDSDLTDVSLDEFTRLANTSRRIVERAADVVLSDVDVTTAFDILSDVAELEAAADDLDKQLYQHENATAAFAFGLLLDSVRRTASYGRNIAEMGIQQAIRREETEMVAPRDG
ncbi:Phosphate uptake regulator [Halogranum rubrum]|uniref:Phosphate uptake regulator n=1 Tax=Halogranum rubrum TaxID=553466 RepID=A0A1I4BI67_9EURY|nr:phosphate uptake regulator PhoU [Halogranum rubrum]SFK67719.1 Phosphate uptake regulator [Halogranum rubrum]